MANTKFTNLEATGTLTAGGVATLNGGAVTPKLTTTVTALTKADNYALAAAEKTLVVGVTLSAGSKTVTLGLAAGQVAIVKNTGATNAFTVKNVADDTGTSLAAGKSLLVVGNATANASIVIALD